MRKILLAAAVAGSALALAACSDAGDTEADETVEAMNADAETATDNAGEEVEATAGGTAASIEAAADAAALSAILSSRTWRATAPSACPRRSSREARSPRSTPSTPG